MNFKNNLNAFNSIFILFFKSFFKSMQPLIIIFVTPIIFLLTIGTSISVFTVIPLIVTVSISSTAILSFGLILSRIKHSTMIKRIMGSGISKMQFLIFVSIFFYFLIVVSMTFIFLLILIFREFGILQEYIEITDGGSLYIKLPTPFRFTTMNWGGLFFGIFTTSLMYMSISMAISNLTTRVSSYKLYAILIMTLVFLLAMKSTFTQYLGEHRYIETIALILPIAPANTLIEFSMRNINIFQFTNEFGTGFADNLFFKVPHAYVTLLYPSIFGSILLAGSFKFFKWTN